MRVLSETAFLTGLADELGRDDLAAWTRLGALDDVELLRVLAWIEQMTPLRYLGDIAWEHASLGDLYRLYATETVGAAL